MQPPSTTRNGSYQHLAIVRPQPPGQFTAELVGLPEVRATAPNREEALRQLGAVVGEWLASGQLVALEVPPRNPWLDLPGRSDPNDPMEQEFLAELERARQEDLERTLREYDREDQRCSDTSSTPTT